MVYRRKEPLSGIIKCIATHYRNFSTASKTNIKWAIRIASTLAFVVFVNRTIGASDIVKLTSRVNIYLLFTAVLIGVVSFFFQAFRWSLILRSHKLPSNAAVSLKTLLRGCLLAFITPGRVGELFRAINIENGREFSAVLAVVEERSFAVIATVVTGIICMAVQPMVSTAAVFVPLAAASIILLIICGIFYTELRYGGRTLKKIRFLKKYHDPLIEYINHFKYIPLPQVVLLSAAAHLLLLVQTAILFRMFCGIDTIIGLVAAGEAFSFMLLFPFFIANIGIREYAFSFFITRLSGEGIGISESGAVAFGTATLILIVNIIIPALVGLIWMYFERNYSNLKSD